MRRPGFEPGSSGWKPEILTPVLPTLVIMVIIDHLKRLFLLVYQNKFINGLLLNLIWKKIDLFLCLN